MVQNFDLQLSSSVLLTPDDSDVSANWRPSNSGCATDEGTVVSTDSAPACYDFGERYMVVANYDDGAMIESSGEKTQHMGSLYNYYAATAGTGIITSPGEASNSICPKGWALPSAAEQEQLYFNAYSIHYKDYYAAPTSSEISMYQADAKKLIAKPLSVILSGRFYNGSTAYHFPYTGEYFNRSVSSGPGVVGFHGIMTIDMYTSIAVTVSGGFDDGRGVRCIAR